MEPAARRIWAVPELYKMTLMQTAKAIVTDSHFLIPVVVLCLGCALLMKLY